jgi:hypothetical protein
MTYKEETINGYVKQLWQYLFNSDQLPMKIKKIKCMQFYISWIIIFKRIFFNVRKSLFLLSISMIFHFKDDLH